MTRESVQLEIDGVLYEAESEETARACAAEVKANERELQRRESVFPGTHREKMTALCRLFPTLQDVPGASPWESERLVLWALSGAGSSGALHAVRFVLQVWNFDSDWITHLKEVATRSDPDEEDLLWRGLQRLRQAIEANLTETRRERAVNYNESPRRITEEEITEELFKCFAAVGKFNVVHAFGVWDRDSRTAFHTWTQNPFFP